MPTFLPGLTKTQSARQWILFGQAYHDKGEIYVTARLGGDAGRSDNNYGLNHADVDFKIYERATGTTGPGLGRNISPKRINEQPVTGVSGAVTVTLVFGKDQNVQQTDGQHEYQIRASGTDSHDGGHSAAIEWIPSPPPPPGPYVVVKNKSGHFARKGSTVTLEIGCFSNPDCSGENATHIMVSTDGGAWANSNTFPHTETFTGDGPHNIKIKGVANTIVGKVIDYSFSIGDNDWRASNLTPMKTIRHEFPDVGKEYASGFFNYYTENCEVHEQRFEDILGYHECTANATTSESVGEGSSAYSYTRTGSAIGTSSQSIGGWEWFEIYPDKIVGEIALGSSTYDPDSIYLRIVDKTDNTSYSHSFAPPNSPWFPDSFRQHGMGSHEVEIPYTFIDGHSYEMKMYGEHWTGSHYQNLFSAGPEHNGIYSINNLSLNIFKLEVSKGTGFQPDVANTHLGLMTTKSTAANTIVTFDHVCMGFATDLDYLRETRTVDNELYLVFGGYNGMRIWDECTIPTPIVNSLEINSQPDENGVYEFTSAGLQVTYDAAPILTHSITDQYYHAYLPGTDSHRYGKLTAGQPELVDLLLAETETSLILEIFNACGSKESKTFTIKGLGDAISTGGVGGGGASTGTQTLLSTNTSTAGRPTYHRLITRF